MKRFMWLLAVLVLAVGLYPFAERVLSEVGAGKPGVDDPPPAGAYGLRRP